MLLGGPLLVDRAEFCNFHSKILCGGKLFLVDFGCRSIIEAEGNSSTRLFLLMAFDSILHASITEIGRIGFNTPPVHPASNQILTKGSGSYHPYIYV